MAVAALRNRNYRIWLLGLSVANIGTWMQRIAQDWLVLELTHGSGTALGIVTALQFLPVLLVGPFAGVVADRFPKRWTLLWTQVVVGGCGLAVGALALAGTATLVQVEVIALVLGVANAVFQPTVQAFVLELVTREEVASVVGISGGSFHAARLVGPGLAGVLIASAGTGPVFLLAAATVIGPIVALLRMDPARLHPAPPGAGGAGMFAAGIGYAVRQRPILLVLALTAFVATFAANSPITNALMATTEFHRGARELGLLGSVMAIGALVGAILAARRRTVDPRFVVWAAVAFCAGDLVASLMPGYLLFALALIPVMLAQITFITAANTVLQLESDPAMRGRVMALFTVLMSGTTPIGAPLLGWVSEHLGARVALGGSGAVALLGVVAVVALLGPPVLRRTGRTVETREKVKTQ